MDRSTTTVLSLSDFPEDSTPTRQTDILAQLKDAIERASYYAFVEATDRQIWDIDWLLGLNLGLYSYQRIIAKQDTINMLTLMHT